MLISSMLPWSLFGVGLAPYERLMWFAYGHVEREQRLNQRALVAWCQHPHSYTGWVQACRRPRCCSKRRSAGKCCVSRQTAPLC